MIPQVLVRGFGVVARPIEWAWELVSRPIRVLLAPLDRWQARHRARELEECATALRRAGMHREAAQVELLAAAWRDRT